MLSYAFLTVFELSLMAITFVKTVACFPLWKAAVPEFPEVTSRGVKLERGFALPPGLVITACHGICQFRRVLPQGCPNGGLSAQFEGLVRALSPSPPPPFVILPVFTTVRFLFLESHSIN